MLTAGREFFSSAEFMPHGMCYLWRAEILWLHVISDSLIALAYFSIPFALLYFVSRRHDLQYKWIFHLFAGFIFFCGLTHVLGVWVVWTPDYAVDGLVKAATAAVSVSTALVLWPLIPKALSLPSPADLARKNQQLAGEIVVRRQAEAELLRTRTELEQSVQERTAELARIALDLRQSEQQLRLITNALPALIGYVDAEQRYRFTNAAHEVWLDAARGTLEGRTVRDALGVANYELLRPFIEDALAGRPVTQSARLSFPKGERDVEASLIPHLDGERVIGFYMLVTDVTEQRRIADQLAQRAAQLQQANEELARSNKELDDFAYIASHDLKEPLRGIRHYSAFLLEDHADQLPAEGCQKLETIAKLTGRLEELINALLHYSRLGRTEMAVGPADLNEVLDGVLDALGITLREQQVDIRIPRALPDVICDRARVGEVFQNLIENAVKYNDKAGKWVEIGWLDESDRPEASRESPVLYVKDNGMGIPEQQLESVFRIFKRLHGRDEHGGGSGAGLTIAKKIVERHGGRIWCESATGAGTTFFFTLGGSPEC